MRWDYFGVIGEKDGLFNQIEAAGGGATVPTSQLYDKDYNNFAPRFGFSYDLTGKGRTVIRGGWGLFYDAFAQDIFLGHVPYNCAFCPGPALYELARHSDRRGRIGRRRARSQPPVFSGFSAVERLFRGGSQPSHSLHPELQPESAAATGWAGRCSRWAM